MYKEPLGVKVDFNTGVIPGAKKIVRRLSDMKGYFLDEKSWEELVKKEDPIVYEVYAIEQEEKEGDLNFATTILYPGKVGKEFFFTKGHYHSKKDRAEVYVALKGKGGMLLQTPEGEARWIPMEPGTVVYVPPYWAHRTVNTGDEPFIFLAIYPADAGHDYGTIAERGFSKIVIEENGEVKVVDNPRWKS
ncbi:glucose-6-phosphate isomerase [Pyrococcus abyssi]|uniref:Glucose-6-phosphate isomerase n=1 Tax=Pyrococcus abyssi (strain GE5 / Orsay) TaxID=272844 RepID=G6PI_PYRAB|nr:glucose-6-phosphate isomerase [Pyrococcus abyssi]Q9UXW3.1 RecName: Full=Glucose-6-phosphate isomerase; Short=GPI; AltName: Full=Phosphoglucose isomerase; Short=PGI; AltName: Full=Phosphohexose isomerase; Short=PHI [Pyrococcus abyssi GE5]CAB50650.1 Glucose-6-phosphate isomerase [Pyrococcus abyssi GE5]